MMKKLAALLVLSLAVMLSAKTVRVTEFNPTPDDATKALQEAFDSGADTVLVDDPGYEYLTLPLQLRSNQEVVFQDGVIVRAMPDAYKGTNDVLFTAKDVENLVLRGEGTAILKMNKKDYQDKNRYKPAEWRHALSLLHCQNVAVQDLTLASSGGDGIYIAKDSKDIQVANCDIVDNHRQGISVINAENVIIGNCKIHGTSGTAPEAGIDFEPNFNSEPIVNNVVTNCDIYDNAGSGVAFALPFNSVKPVSITIMHCRIENNGNSELEFIPRGDKTGPLYGFIDILDCQMKSTKGRPLTFTGLRNGCTAITFRDCIFDAEAVTTKPILFKSESPDDISGVNFGNTIMLFDPAKPLLDLDGIGLAAFLAPWGKLTLRHDGKDTIYDFTEAVETHPGHPSLKKYKARFTSKDLQTKGLVPATWKGDDGDTVAVRGKVSFLQYAEAGMPVELKFKVIWARNPGGTMDVEILDPSGKRLSSQKVECPEDILAINAPQNGVYCVRLNTGGRSVSVTSDAPGFGYCADGSGLPTFHSNHVLYFEVGADQTEVFLEFCTDAREGMAVELRDENGNIVADTGFFETLNYLCAQRQPSSDPVLWSIRLYKVVEDNCVRIGAPSEPIFYASPNDWLRRE